MPQLRKTSSQVKASIHSIHEMGITINTIKNKLTWLHPTPDHLFLRLMDEETQEVTLDALGSYCHNLNIATEFLSSPSFRSHFGLSSRASVDFETFSQCLFPSRNSRLTTNSRQYNNAIRSTYFNQLLKQLSYGYRCLLQLEVELKKNGIVMSQLGEEDVHQLTLSCGLPKSPNYVWQHIRHNYAAPLQTIISNQGTQSKNSNQLTSHTSKSEVNVIKYTKCTDLTLVPKHETLQIPINLQTSEQDNRNTQDRVSEALQTLGILENYIGRKRRDSNQLRQTIDQAKLQVNGNRRGNNGTPRNSFIEANQNTEKCNLRQTEIKRLKNLSFITSKQNSSYQFLEQNQQKKRIISLAGQARKQAQQCLQAIQNKIISRIKQQDKPIQSTKITSKIGLRLKY